MEAEEVEAEQEIEAEDDGKDVDVGVATQRLEVDDKGYAHEEEIEDNEDA